MCTRAKDHRGVDLISDAQPRREVGCGTASQTQSATQLTEHF